MLFLLFCMLMFISSCDCADPKFTYCQDSPANYTTNSAFGNNLKQLLQNLSLHTPPRKGFYKISAGDGTNNQVYGRALCRGDVVIPSICMACLQNASREILKDCKTRKGIIWDELCQIEYSYGMMSIMVYTGKSPLSNHLEKNVSDPVNFQISLDTLMKRLSDEASFGSSGLMFATGKVRLLRNETIYGLVQCTRDISPSDCRSCLSSSWGDLQSCCSSRQGGTIFSRNCNMRFEMDPFYTVNTHLNEMKNWKIWLAVGASTMAFMLAGLAAGFFLCKRRKKKQKDEEKIRSALLDELASPNVVTVTQEGVFSSSQELPFMELDMIKTATNNFSDSNKLGQGGFGTVYKGVLSDGGKEVAVKRLSRKSWQGLEEFKNEVMLIAKLQHRNLVRLVGCGIEGEEKLLVYEYMPNKSLDIFIFDSEKSAQLHWDMRLKIIHGISRGLLYLHQDSRLRIIHRDLKPSNILLDSDMVAKISDFGMARIFGVDQNIANTKRVVGTYGYMAPEYAMEGHFSVKSDVFSFGVILLEIVAGKRNSGFYLTKHSQTLLAYAWRLWNEGKELELFDPLLRGSCSVSEVTRCIHVGLLCVQEDPEDRPDMSSVVVLLGSDSLTLPEPGKPAFSVCRVAPLPESHSTTDPSINQLTISSVSPR